jgi:hypothetical protein
MSHIFSSLVASDVMLLYFGKCLGCTRETVLFCGGVVNGAAGTGRAVLTGTGELLYDVDVASTPGIELEARYSLLRRFH